MSNQKLPYPFLKEEIEKQNRNSKFLHFEQFQTNINRVPITGKFWSKYDSKVESLDEVKHQNYLKQIEKSMIETPKDKYIEPIIESHRYGWISGPFIKYDARDMELFYFPRINNRDLRVTVPSTTKFSGIPFKLS